MAKLEELNITVTYRVGLKDINVSDSVFNGLNKIVENKRGEIYWSEFIDDEDILDAKEWLTSRINESDAWVGGYEIDLG